MRRHLISATEASRSLSDVLNKVHYQGETFDIQRGKEIIARISPVEPKKSLMKGSDLKDFFNHLPKLEKDDSVAFENDINQIRASMHTEEDPWA